MQAVECAERGTLSREEVRRLFRLSLEQELMDATRHHTAPISSLPPHPTAHRIMRAAYEVISRVAPDADGIADAVVNEVIDETWSEADRTLLVKMLRLLITPNIVNWRTVDRLLRGMNTPANDATRGEARSTLLRGKIEAQRRAELWNHPLLAATGDPAFYLLDDDWIARARMAPFLASAPAPSRTDESAAPPLFAQATNVRFSEQIDALLDSVFTANEWQPDGGKARLMLQTFAWITGDKAMSDYRPSDIVDYVKALLLIPTDFVWGKLNESGGMAQPYHPSLFPKTVPADRKRSARTINSYLSKLAAASNILKDSYWRPYSGHGNAMDFNARRRKVAEDPADPPRMPWTPEHLEVMYGLPLWQGGGGAHKRVKKVPRPTVYQDAAYWVPLIGTYTGLAREEACGLEVLDFNFEVAVPYLLVQANLTRSKDGATKAGLKRASRRRVMPLHPELLRLGMQEYVAAIAAEGRTMIFPELYLAEAKAGKQDATSPASGGRRFYSIAWCFIMDATHGLSPLPQTAGGKKADFHSQRTYNNSVLASPEVSETLIADHMGHSRRGTGARNYNRRNLALGVERELRERLSVLEAQMPVVTAHVPRAATLNLLPLFNRSRVGSAAGRNAKSRFCE